MGVAHRSRLPAGSGAPKWSPMQHSDQAIAAESGGVEPTVYYDGACPLCRREIDFARKRAPELRYVDVSDGEGAPPPGVSREDALARFHVSTGDGEVRSGAAAFAVLWSRIPALKPLARLVERPRVSPWAERAYRAFLRVRPAAQRLVSRWDARRAGS